VPPRCIASCDFYSSCAFFAPCLFCPQITDHGLSVPTRIGREPLPHTPLVRAEGFSLLCLLVRRFPRWFFWVLFALRLHGNRSNIFPPLTSSRRHVRFVLLLWSSSPPITKGVIRSLVIYPIFPPSSPDTSFIDAYPRHYKLFELWTSHGPSFFLPFKPLSSPSLMLLHRVFSILVPRSSGTSCIEYVSAARVKSGGQSPPWKSGPK